MECNYRVSDGSSTAMYSRTRYHPDNTTYYLNTHITIHKVIYCQAALDMCTSEVTHPQATPSFSMVHLKPWVSVICYRSYIVSNTWSVAGIHVVIRQ